MKWHLILQRKTDIGGFLRITKKRNDQKWPPPLCSRHLQARRPITRRPDTAVSSTIRVPHTAQTVWPARTIRRTRDQARQLVTTIPYWTRISDIPIRTNSISTERELHNPATTRTRTMALQPAMACKTNRCTTSSNFSRVNRTTNCTVMLRAGAVERRHRHVVTRLAQAPRTLPTTTTPAWAVRVQPVDTATDNTHTVTAESNLTPAHINEQSLKWDKHYLVAPHSLLFFNKFVSPMLFMKIIIVSTRWTGVVVNVTL